jgi:hypothetical protein
MSQREEAPPRVIAEKEGFTIRRFGLDGDFFSRGRRTRAMQESYSAEDASSKSAISTAAAPGAFLKHPCQSASIRGSPLAKPFGKTSRL